MNSENIMKEINFLMSDDVSEEEKENYIEDNEHPDRQFLLQRVQYKNYTLLTEIIYMNTVAI